MRAGVIGYGSVGQAVARRLHDGSIPGVVLSAIASGDLLKAQANAQDLAPLVVTNEEAIERSDVLVECATVDAFPSIANAVLSRGRSLVAVSAAGLLNVTSLVELGLRYGARIQIVSGAIPGMDLIRSAREGKISSVRLTSRLRPDSLLGEAFITETGLDLLASNTEAIQVFTGTAAEAGLSFPRHFNVAITLGLGGIGLERTRVDVWSDPRIDGSIHKIDIEGDEISATMICRNKPSINRRTSSIVALSVMAALRTSIGTIVYGN